MSNKTFTFVKKKEKELNNDSCSHSTRSPPEISGRGESKAGRVNPSYLPGSLYIALVRQREIRRDQGINRAVFPHFRRLRRFH